MIWRWAFIYFPLAGIRFSFFLLSRSTDTFIHEEMPRDCRVAMARFWPDGRSMWLCWHHIAARRSARSAITRALHPFFRVTMSYRNSSRKSFKGAQRNFFTHLAITDSSSGFSSRPDSSSSDESERIETLGWPPFMLPNRDSCGWDECFGFVDEDGEWQHHFIRHPPVVLRPICRRPVRRPLVTRFKRGLLLRLRRQPVSSFIRSLGSKEISKCKQETPKETPEALQCPTAATFYGSSRHRIESRWT